MRGQRRLGPPPSRADDGLGGRLSRGRALHISAPTAVVRRRGIAAICRSLSTSAAGAAAMLIGRVAEAAEARGAYNLRSGPDFAIASAR